MGFGRDLVKGIFKGANDGAPKAQLAGRAFEPTVREPSFDLEDVSNDNPGHLPWKVSTKAPYRDRVFNQVKNLLIARDDANLENLSQKEWGRPWIQMKERVTGFMKYMDLM